MSSATPFGQQSPAEASASASSSSSSSGVVTRGTGTYPHAHPFLLDGPLPPAGASPAVRIAGDSLATAFSFLLISERLLACQACRYWCWTGQTRQSWQSTYFYPATSRRFLRFPPYLAQRVQTLDWESVMDECAERTRNNEERVEEEDEEEQEGGDSDDDDHDDGGSGGVSEAIRTKAEATGAMDSSEEDEDAEEKIDLASPAAPAAASIAPLSAVDPLASISPSLVLRRDRLWLRLLRHLRRYTRLRAFLCTGVRNNDPHQLLAALEPVRGVLEEFHLSGACHPRRTDQRVKAWRGLEAFRALKAIAFPYAIALPMLQCVIRNSIRPTTREPVPTGQQQLEETEKGETTIPFTCVDQEAAAAMHSWLLSLGASAPPSAASSMAASSSSSPLPAAAAAAAAGGGALVYHLPSRSLSGSFCGLTHLCLKFWRSVYLHDDCAEEIEGRDREHLYMRQALGHLPHLTKLQVFGVHDERTLAAICCHPRLSKRLKALALGIHAPSAFDFEGFRALSQLSQTAPALEHVELRLAIPMGKERKEREEEQDDGGGQEEDGAPVDGEEEGAQEAMEDERKSTDDSASISGAGAGAARRSMNYLLLSSLSRLVSLKSLSLRLLHSVDAANLVIVYPQFFTPLEARCLGRMDHLEALECEVVTRRTSRYLSRSFNPGVLPVVLKAGAAGATATGLAASLTSLTLFSPCMRDLAALSECPKLKTLKLISTKASIILKQRRKGAPVAAAGASAAPAAETGSAQEQEGDAEGQELEDDIEDGQEDDTISSADADLLDELEREVAQQEQKEEEEKKDSLAHTAGDVAATMAAAAATVPSIPSTSVSASPPHSIASAAAAGASSLDGHASSSEEEDDHDENLGPYTHSLEQRSLRATCRYLHKAIEAAQARLAGEAIPGPRVLYFGSSSGVGGGLPSLENLTLSSCELEVEDFRTLGRLARMKYLHLNRCCLGRFRLVDQEEGHRATTTTTTTNETTKTPAEEKNETTMMLNQGEEQGSATSASSSSSSRALDTFPSTSAASAASSSTSALTLLPSICFTHLAASTSLTRLSLALSDTYGPFSGFLPPLQACVNLTSLTVTNWAAPVSEDLLALRACRKLVQLEFNLAEFREAQMECLLPAARLQEANADAGVMASPREASSGASVSVGVRHLVLIGCGVLTAAEELARRSSSYVPLVRDSTRHRHSAVPPLTCAPLYAWSGLASFLEECFQRGMSVKHKRYY